MRESESGTPVRWGILSTAKIGRDHVIPALQRSQRGEVVALASRDGDRARRVADALGIPTAYSSYEALLEDPQVEAIYNPLPNHLHVPWSVRAAEAGKHVLCEKPIGLDADEARRLAEARDRTGVVVAEAFMVRTHPQWLEVRDRVWRGELGELRSVACQFSYYKDDPNDIRSRPEWGGGGLMDIGCYAVHIARWLFDAEPERVVALVRRDPDTEVDTLTSGILDFGAGRATFTCGTLMVPYQRVQVLGSRGRIEVEIPFNAPADRPCRIRIDDGSDLAGAGVRTVELDPIDQYAAQGDAVGRAIRDGGPVPVPVDDSVRNMAVLDALFRSETSGRWEVPES
ncbi:MAG: Gfo/Idh/MocA family oxidoreductase [Longimicrobiales bacterium]|nr:Gfo/Idh/MocA family oxidoreductase [Longimicrobiales bacterium]